MYERVLQLAIRISRDVNEARKKLMDEERSVPRLPSQKVQSCK